ncbi:hypothetical protein KUC60_19620, partial [Pseudomonas aeruginosa]|nr:hypothetical protein [Pseudomonas aeruginosa]
MPIKMNLSGLKRLQQNLKQLDGTHQVPFSEIMSPSFISSNSRRPQKLSATPDHFGKVLPHVLSRTQRHRARHDPDRPVQWLQPA